MDFSSGALWGAFGAIVAANILLSGDNAVVIALAARSLPDHQRNKAIFAGSAAAIVLRVGLTVFAVQLLQFPYLKIVGAVLLFWIGVQLLLPVDENEDGIKSSEHLWSAVRTILLADLVMSVDNVLAVAAAADSGPPESRLLLLIIGLGLSIPLIIFGSQLLMKVMESYPVIITIGAALLAAGRAGHVLAAGVGGPGRAVAVHAALDAGARAHGIAYAAGRSDQINQTLYVIRSTR